MVPLLARDSGSQIVLAEESVGVVQAGVQYQPPDSMIPCVAALLGCQQFADPVHVVDCPHVGISIRGTCGAGTSSLL